MSLLWLAGFFAVCAGLCAPLVPWELWRARRRVRRSVPAEGTITAVRPDDVHHDGFVASVRYALEGRTFTLEVGSSGRYREGEQVVVRHVPSAPAESYVDQGGRVWSGAIVAALLAVGFGVTALVLYAVARAAG